MTCPEEDASASRFDADPPELWGGVECTINRVGDCHRDQLVAVGHYERGDDIRRFADLGLRALRVPVLWERVAPRGLAHADWSWPDRLLASVRAAGLRPIVGLLHHGSGPAHTHLCDDGFVDGLAEFARAVAERYPWVADFTPVNEPLTTARFSALYGLWFPHARDECSFARALVNQVRGVAEAMRAVREVVPGARLVQTEDASRTTGTPETAAATAFYDARAWLTYDLLFGRMVPGHPLHQWLVRALDRPSAEPDIEACETRVDVVGLNYYVTSDRFLDHRIDVYPEGCRPAGEAPYVDVEAVRVRGESLFGHARVLEQAWSRYRSPLAFTEVHLGCTREEQLRWMYEAWQAACEARRRGMPVVAVTAWSLLGSTDWDSLLVECRGHYEPGVFDVRTEPPRPTALATLVARLASGGTDLPPGTTDPGWWRREIRFELPPAAGCTLPEPGRLEDAPPRQGAATRRSPVLVTGAGGTLGAAFARVCERRGLACRLASRGELDVTDAVAVARVLDEVRPWAVVNAAGYVRVDQAESDRDACLRANVDGPVVLAGACAARGIRLAAFSSDLVFDGASARPYLEVDRIAPLNVYGLSKARMEHEVLRAFGDALVVRTSAFFGPWDPHNFVTATLRQVAARQPVHAAGDLVVTPTYVPDLVDATLDLLLDAAAGVWHVANATALSWADIAATATSAARLPASFVIVRPAAALGLAARRPTYSALGTGRGLALPSFESALDRYLRDRRVA